MTEAENRRSDCGPMENPHPGLCGSIRAIRVRKLLANRQSCGTNPRISAWSIVANFGRGFRLLWWNQVHDGNSYRKQKYFSDKWGNQQLSLL